MSVWRCVAWLSLAAGGCGQPEVGAEAPPSPAPALDVAPADGSDPLLARARATMRGGELDPAVKAEILASDDPAHARARRLLAAMDQESGETPEPASSKQETPTLHVGEGDAATAKRAAAEQVADTDVKPPAKAAAPAKVERARAVLRRLSLRESSTGMTLTLHASEGVLVGSAHQPMSGTLRLVVESVGAEPKLLSSRPSRGDVRVTDVQRGENTVIIKLAVPPGWRVGRTRRFPGGARVDLVAP